MPRVCIPVCACVPAENERERALREEEEAIRAFVNKYVCVKHQLEEEVIRAFVNIYITEFIRLVLF